MDMDNELKEFWEWCGFRFQDLNELKAMYRHEANRRWVSPLGETGSLPELTLGNLFKYAVPKLTFINLSGSYDKEGDGFTVSILQGKRLEHFLSVDKDPTQALYQAIRKVIK